MKRLGLILLFLNGLFANAQDIHFTQIQQAPLTINPANAGFFNGWERIAVNHKNQWISSGSKFFTSSIAADFNLFRKRTVSKPYLGFGLQLFRDAGGDSQFGAKELMVSVSGIIPLSQNHTISTGIQVGMAQKSGDLTALSFSNQFDGTRFNESKPSFEGNILSTSIYADFSTGFLYRYRNSKLAVQRDNLVDFTAGISYSHLNRPRLKFRQGGEERLYGKFVGNLSLIRDIEGSNSGFEFYFNQTLQGPHNESLIGFIYRYRLNTSSVISSFSRNAYLKLGLSYRLKDAISPILSFEYNAYQFGISYDVTVSEFSQTAYSGGLEFSFSYTNLGFALIKRKSRF